MLRTLKCPVIALEEHYWDKELAALFAGAEGVPDPQTLKRRYDLGELRLSEMDEAGIDVQILSHGAPSAQKLSGADAVDITRHVNDRLHAAVVANPKRFAAFAALPTNPVGAGFVNSLSGPDGNATGFTPFEYGVNGANLRIRVRRSRKRYDPAKIHDDIHVQHFCIEGLCLVQLIRSDVWYDTPDSHERCHACPIRRVRIFRGHSSSDDHP